MDEDNRVLVASHVDSVDVHIPSSARRMGDRVLYPLLAILYPFLCTPSSIRELDKDGNCSSKVIERPDDLEYRICNCCLGRC